MSEEDYELVEVTTLGDPGPVYVRGACLHRDTVPVTSCVDGELLARLCRVCNRQLTKSGMLVVE